MKRVIVLIFVLLIQTGFSQSPSDFVLKPCYGSSILNAQTSEGDLVKIVGKKNVERVERLYA
jgi:hypothetical protein